MKVRHDELDWFGRVHPAVYLRHLAQVAVDASTAAGFAASWYAARGINWLVRRSTFEVREPARAGTVLEIRTWVEDFRRVRSHRRYEASAGGRTLLTARTDWVLVDSGNGRPRRIPEEIERGLGGGGGASQERPGWAAPPAPAGPARSTHRVRAHELDSLGHVNNAAYLDFLTQGVLDALGEVGWPLDQQAEQGVLPLLVRGDIEYLEAARYGEELVTATWFTPRPGGLDAHQVLGHAGGGRPLVRATTGWRWTTLGGEHVEVPAPLLAALARLLAA